MTPRFAPRSLARALLLSSALFLAACESAEEKAEGYYQSALALLEEGDTDRALIELRNVFQYNGFHKEARELFASTLLEQGDVGAAVSQYLRLIEQYPETQDPEMVRVRHVLAELAIARGDWEQARLHGGAAITAAPEDLRSRAISAMVDYAEASLLTIESERAEARGLAVAEARAVLDEDASNLTARRVVIFGLLDSNEPTDALPEIDLLLADDPMAFDFHDTKFKILFSLERMEEAGLQLEEMYRLFPDNMDVRTSIIGFYVASDDTERAEAILRELAGDPAGETSGHQTVVQFLRLTQGDDAARTELQSLIAANEGTANADLYQMLDAVITFDQGDPNAAIAQLRDVTAAAENSDQTREIKMILAGMLLATNDQVGARALVEEVLSEDAAQVAALKMRAGWKIEADDPEGAIADLRIALDQAPRDSSVLILMANAHDRAGQRELAGERLALAFDVSEAAVDVSILYARFLLGQTQIEAAVDVLRTSYDANPGTVQLLAVMADVHIRTEEWTELQAIMATLQALGTDDAMDLANSIEAAMLVSQGRTDESIAFIQDNLLQPGNDMGATVTIVLTYLRAGDIDAAQEVLDEAMATNPDDPTLRLMQGAMLAGRGDLEGAEAIYREVAADVPTSAAPARMLFRLLARQGRMDEAAAVLTTAVEANPENRELLIMQAGVLEQQGDPDGAIAIYEVLYESNTNDTQIANNLASLLASYRSDPEDLERAYTVGQRLRGLTLPHYQDTYGWLEYLQGNYENALVSLEPASEGLPDQPLVLYHLGMTYAALERPEEAITALERAIALGQGRDLPQLEVARTTITQMQALVAEN